VPVVELRDEAPQGGGHVARDDKPVVGEWLNGKTLDKCLEQVVFPAEVVVDQAFGHAGAFGDARCRGGLEAACGEEFLGGAKDALPGGCLFGVGVVRVHGVNVLVWGAGWRPEIFRAGRPSGLQSVLTEDPAVGGLGRGHCGHADFYRQHTCPASAASQLTQGRYCA
jgi:hypothetical protein